MDINKTRLKIGKQMKTQTIMRILSTAFVCALTLAGLFIVLSFVLTKFNLPLYAVTPLSTVAVCVASFIAASHLVSKTQENGMLSGFFTGLGVCFVLVVVALLKGTFSANEQALFKLIAICCSGAIGGYYGLIRGERKRKTKHQ